MPRPFNPRSYSGWRKLVLARDEHRCVACGSKEHVEIDHITPYSKAPELRLELTNGRTLCKSCHKVTDTYGGRARTWRAADQ